MGKPTKTPPVTPIATEGTHQDGETPCQRIDHADINKAIEVLRKGGVILYPTDTVWGIGCDATNPEAIKRIYSIKQRADSKAMIVLVDSLAMLERHVEEVPDVAYQLIEASVRPTTIVYDKGIGLAPELLAADGSVGIRISNERFSAMLCQRLHRPIVSTSANISGAPTAKFFNEISADIINQVDYVVQYRQKDRSKALPSCVIKLTTTGVITVLRK